MKYRTIVADPPWDHSDGTGWNPGVKDWRGQSGTGEPKVTGLPYEVLSVSDICDLPVTDLADGDAHLYLWTTNRFLRDSYRVAEAWGFTPTKPLIWCKKPMGFMGGSFTSSAEFILFARRGSLAHQARAGRQWWVWPRGKHSVKPDAFQDIVEQVSPGPYLEMFARRKRLGWDVWGDEVESDVELKAA